MTKLHAAAELDQAGLDRRRRSVGPDREPLGCSPHQRRLAHRIRRRELQEAPGLPGKRVQAPPETLLDVPRERNRVRECEAARQLCRRDAAWQLQECQGIAARLGDDLVPNTRVQWPRQDGIQQRARIVLAQTFDHEFRQSR